MLRVKFDLIVIIMSLIANLLSFQLQPCRERMENFCLRPAR